MAWQHKFLSFNLLGFGVTQELATCVVDGIGLEKLPEWEAIKATGKKKPTLGDLLNKFGEQGWQVASQSIAPTNNQQNFFKETYLHFMTLKREV
ncbi:hypothetical protein SynA18461_01293 [Synechococcus sp. A18-46.1]|nr:hypothetical protein SynA18461_01293 [Synechococcus sp. A18-46.1]